MEKKFPEGMVPLGKEPFSFSCHTEIGCFTRCCRGVEMYLFPYDILRLKNALGIDSGEFLHKYTRIVSGTNPYFPSLMLKLNEQKCCPFLQETGCTVYRNRPSSCRTYPLERAVDRNPQSGEQGEFYFLTQHDYCLGHKEDREFTVAEWVRNQDVHQFNVMNDLWGEMDTLFASNPWKGEGSGGEKQRLAFMVCYDLDGFRKFVNHHNLLKKFTLNKDIRKRIKEEDEELLKFGFEWLKLLFAGKSSLTPK